MDIKHKYSVGDSVRLTSDPDLLEKIQKPYRRYAGKVGKVLHQERNYTPDGQISPSYDVEMKKSFFKSDVILVREEYLEQV